MLASLEVHYYKFRGLQVDFFNDAQFAFVTSNAGGSQTYGAEVQVDWATPVEGLFIGKKPHRQAGHSRHRRRAFNRRQHRNGSGLGDLSGGTIRPRQYELELA